LQSKLTVQQMDISATTPPEMFHFSKTESILHASWTKPNQNGKCRKNLQSSFVRPHW